MNKTASFVCLLLPLAQSLTLSTRTLVVAQGRPQDDKQLRNEALANSEVHLAARSKNPRISENGLDPGYLRTLDPQRAYPASRPPLAGSDTNNRNHGTLLSPPSERKSSQLLAPRPSSSAQPAAACHVPMIRSVNGTREGAIFTPKEPGNIYTIEGCLFGNTRGRVQLEPRSPAPGYSLSPIALHLDSTARGWSEHEITARLDPHLSGVPDSAVTLVIYSGSGQRLELHGCLFVARRGEPQLLRVVPASWVSLHATKVRSRSIGQLEYVSPPLKGNEVPKDVGGTSALVVRSDSERFGPGSDTYNFSNLAPGWVVDSVQLQTYSIACPLDITYAESFGRWDLTWEPRGFTVSWGGDACKSYPLPFFNFSLSFSQYAAKVWVIGPVGTHPIANGF